MVEPTRHRRAPRRTFTALAATFSLLAATVLVASSALAAPRDPELVSEQRRRGRPTLGPHSLVRTRERRERGSS